MDAQGHLEVSLSQGDSVLPLYNHSSAGNSFPQGWTPSWGTPASEYPAATGVPDWEMAQTVSKMQAGLVMAVTLWSGDTHWLDTSACEGAPRCDMKTANFIVSDLQIRKLSAITTVATSTRTTTLAQTVTVTNSTNRISASSTGSAHPAITSTHATEEDNKHTSSSTLERTSTLIPGQIFWPDTFAKGLHLPGGNSSMQNATAGGKVAGGDVAPTMMPILSITALPLAKTAKPVPRFPKAFQSSTGREASFTVEAAAAASISSVFSLNLVLLGLIVILPMLGCVIAAQRRSYLRGWLQVPRGWLQVRRLDSDTCLIGSE